MENEKFYDIFKTEKERFVNKRISELARDKCTESQIEEYFSSDKFISDYFQNCDRFTSDMVSNYINDSFIKDTTTKEAKEHFLNHINDIYGDSFLLFDLYINLLTDICDEYYELSNEECVNSDSKEVAVLFKIFNGVAIRTTREILCLLENGFPHGAVARWRTLYEIWIIMEYIARHDNVMAKKYIKHNNPCNNYSWAKSDKVIPKHRKYSFEDLQTYVNSELDKTRLEHKSDGNTYADWIEEYRISNQMLHISSTGIFGYWDKRQDNKQIYIDGSAVGFLKPASNALGCLYNINRLAFSVFDGEYNNLLLLLLRKLSDETMKSFDYADKYSSTPNE